MATFEEIMLGLNPKGGNNGNTEVYNNLFMQAPATPSGAVNQLRDDYRLRLAGQQPQPFGPVNQQAQPISILGQAPATPSGVVNQWRDAYGLAFADQQAQLNAQAQAQPLGPQSPFLPSGEKAVWAMTPEEVAARQAGRNRLLDDSMIGSLSSLVGDLVYGKDRGASGSFSLSTNLPPTFTPPSEGATPREGVQGLEPISLAKLGLESPQQAAMRERFNPTQTLITPTFNSGVQTESSTQPGGTTTQSGDTTPQPEATFLRADGTIEKIYPGESISSKFPNTPNTPLIGTPIVEGQPTFQGTNLPDGIGFQRAPEGMVKAIGPDGKMVFATPEDANRMNAAYAAENTANTRAQQEFLASPAARGMSNRMLQSVMNDPYAQASREREARLAARPDFMRAVSDSERRGTGEMSMAAATKLTGGDRDKARAMIELQRQQSFSSMANQERAMQERAKLSQKSAELLLGFSGQYDLGVKDINQARDLVETFGGADKALNALRDLNKTSDKNTVEPVVPSTFSSSEANNFTNLLTGMGLDAKNLNVRNGVIYSGNKPLSPQEEFRIKGTEAGMDFFNRANNLWNQTEIINQKTTAAPASSAGAAPKQNAPYYGP